MDRATANSRGFEVVMTDDTIAAVASAPGGGLNGVVRLSGPDARRCIEACLECEPLPESGAGCVRSAHLRLAAPWPRVSCELYWWPGPRSYTRQATAEIHTIGAPPLLDALLAALLDAGARLARPGEFTLRAFLAGRLDLVQAEAVLGVIDATTQAELGVALRQLAGGMTGPLNALRDQLLETLAHLEAGLDFVEEDIQFITAGELDGQLTQAIHRLDALELQLRTRGESGGARRVAIVGWPNVGKSSLLNALVGEQAALVADVPGTTRDYLVRRVTWDGLTCELIDTAGIEPDADPSAAAGAAQEMTRRQQLDAHLQLFCLDASRPLNEWERAQLTGAPLNRAPLSGEQLNGARPATAEPVDRLIVWTKCDLTRDGMAVAHTFGRGTALSCSAYTGDGLVELKQELLRRLASSVDVEAGAVAGTAVRCAASIRRASVSLSAARSLVASQHSPELVAFELRAALDHLGEVVGAVYTDDILDRIFSRFCIGK